MQQRTLGKSLVVSAMGLGCMRMSARRSFGRNVQPFLPEIQLGAIDK